MPHFSRAGLAGLMVFVAGAARLAADAAAVTNLLFRTTPVTEVALAPDGQALAWVQGNPNLERKENPGALLWMTARAGDLPRPATMGRRAGRTEKRPVWSPDGRWLAYLSDEAQPHQQQLYVQPASGGPARMLTNVQGQIDWPRWSPDGRTIAALVIAGLDRPAGAVEAAAPDAGEVRETFYEQRLALIDAAGGAMRLVSPANEYVYEFDWSPDGAQLVCSLAPGSGDNNWWIARLAVVPAAGGPLRELYRPATQVAVPRWSPDGSTIAFIQGLMSDQGSTGGEVWTVPAAGGAARSLTPGRTSTVAWLHWLPTGELLVSDLMPAGVQFGRFNPATGTTEPIAQLAETATSGRESFSLSTTPDGRRWAAIRSSWDHPPEAWTGPNWAQRTAVNAGVAPRWGHSERIEWQSDGRTVSGWLIYPLQYDPARKYPLLVGIHGGPASMKLPVWPQLNFDLGPLAGEGYFVFFPNPRGSYGQGEAFTAANVRDFGFGDLRDILRGLDRVLAHVPVDPARVGVGGWSYGGFMTMWAVTQTTRFHAAVSGAGIANWQSYYGENLIDRWMVPYFGATVYDDPEAYQKSSPIRYIKAVKTPTLILVGDGDKECPAPQSYEFWHALRTLGVDTRFVLYPGEGHHMRKAADIEDIYRRTIEWYNSRLVEPEGVK
jgi:dipeptidyl aminopeptidase/acylaminoacyl peptidase